MKTYATISGFIAAFLLSTSIQAAENATSERSEKERTAAPQQNPGMSNRDEKFVKDAASGGQLEVTLGEMAKDKATNPEVKQFGERMATDHSKANAQLKSYASKKNIEVPEKLDGKDQAVVEKFSKLSGPEFDKAYMGLMVKDHRKDVSEFEQSAKRAEDPELKSWVEKTLPTLKEHLQKAETIDNTLGNKKGM